LNRGCASGRVGSRVLVARRRGLWSERKPPDSCHARFRSEGAALHRGGADADCIL